MVYAYEGVFSRAEVFEAVARAREVIELTATVRNYLPVLIKRYAEELLGAQAQSDGRIGKAVPEILFVCVHNAGRSQMAAAFAAHLAPGKVHVRSAGSQPRGDLNPLAVEVLAERGIDLAAAYSKPLSDSFVHAADVIITMGCGDACPYYPGKRYEDWDVGDPDGRTLDEVRDIRDDILARVSELLRELGL
ncbi:MAG TPA: arsenate reductase ArsC [Candidatus Limnocylindrales bacterium]|nr:arsenate reductase ArsC [Candidatus Limnocylindrales bacterium]